MTRRSILALTGAGLLGLGLAACGNDSDSLKPSASVTTLMALDTSGAVMGQQIARLPGGVGGFQRAYFEFSDLPAADRYRVSVWDYTFEQS
jgi:hypothetical protein